MLSYEQKLEIQEALCKIVENSGDSGIDMENNIQPYLKVQQIVETGTETEKIAYEVLEYLQREKFIKLVQNNERIVYSVENKSLTLKAIQKYFESL